VVGTPVSSLVSVLMMAEKSPSECRSRCQDVKRFKGNTCLWGSYIYVELHLAERGALVAGSHTAHACFVLQDPC
jgi:hypothetical protein